MFKKKSKSKAKAINKALVVCEAVANGDFEARITGIDEYGDFKDLFLAINRLIDRSDAYLRESMACLEYVKDNRYFRRIQEKGMPGSFGHASDTINQATMSIEQRAKNFSGVVEKFEGAMKGVVDSVASASTELESSAKAMDATAGTTSEQATAVAAAAEQTTANVQTVASAAEELASSVNEITRQVTESSEMAGQAVNEAEEVDEQIQGLAQASEKIGAVVQLITDIAAQTNLLALNATIEAARAGEAGKGFAVVASEVKNLAKQTAGATEDISGQVGSIQLATKNAVVAIQKIAGSINKMNEVSAAVAAAVEEQGAASQEIARNVEQAATGTTEVTEKIGLVSAGAAETGGAAGQILNASGELAQQSNRLTTEVDTFLAEVKRVV